MSNKNDKLTSRPWRVIGQLLFKGELRRFLPLILVGSLFANLLALAMPLAILQILDRVVKNNAMDTLFFITVGVVVALALSEVLNIVNGAITSWLGTRFEHNTIVKAVERLFRMPIREYNQREPGSYTEQLSATSQVAGFYSGKALLVLFDMPFIALYLVIIYLIAGWLVWIPVVILGIFALLIYTYGKLIGNQMIERHVSDDRRFGFLYEVLGGIHMVKTMMIERLMIRRYEKLKETNAGQMFKLARDGNLANSLGLVFTQVMMVTTIFGGSIVVLQGDMTPGSLAACMMLAVRSLAPLRQGLLLWVRYQEFMAADQRLKELMELPVRDDKDLKALPAVESSIELKDVSLSFVSTVWDRVKKQEYKKVKTLFDKLSLTIRKGECIALKGESGSGKSRLLALLSALETPDEGEVLYDGHNLAEYLPQSVHQRVALLPQVATVVSGTILDNLTMFDDSLNERALALSRQLGLDDVVAGLRLGYETPLGENSKTSLPEGVAQLVTIARILVREPEVILFDEANIALDMEADIALKNYLADLKGKVTLVLVTPRPSYISMADSVYTIEGGRLIKEESQQQEIKVKDAELPRPETRRNFAEVIDSHFEAPTDLSNCLLPLLEALNWKGRPRDLAEAIPHMEFELSLSGLVTTMANCDFETVSLGKGSRQPDSRLFPCLFVPERGAAMLLLERLEDDRLFVFDGAKGRETEISALSGNGEFFYFKKLETAKAPAAARHSWVVDQLWRFRRHILLILSVSFFHAIFALTPSIFVKSVYQWVLPS
ncbi:MAG: ABC transporter transmembrane domain-containing protein, partial [Gammaproteobacteria bacterium]